MAYYWNFFGWAVCLLCLLQVVGCSGYTSDSVDGNLLANKEWVLLYQKLEDALLNMSRDVGYA